MKIFLVRFHSFAIYAVAACYTFSRMLNWDLPRIYVQKHGAGRKYGGSNATDGSPRQEANTRKAEKQINQKCDMCIRAFQVLLGRYEFKFHLLNSATLSSSTSLGSFYTFGTQQRSIGTKVLKTLPQMMWDGIA
jgi:hypothetical protein